MLSPFESGHLCALDIHLDEIDTLKAKLRRYLVDGGEGELNYFLSGIVIDHEAIPGRVSIYVHRQKVILVPDALRDYNDSAACDLVSKITPQALKVLRRRFDGDDQPGATFQGDTGEYADVRPAIENYIASANVGFGRAIDIELLLSEEHPQRGIREFRNPVFSLGRAPQVIPGWIGPEHFRSLPYLRWHRGCLNVLPQPAQRLHRRARMIDSWMHGKDNSFRREECDSPKAGPSKAHNRHNDCKSIENARRRFSLSRPAAGAIACSFFNDLVVVWRHRSCQYTLLRT